MDRQTPFEVEPVASNDFHDPQRPRPVSGFATTLNEKSEIYTLNDTPDNDTKEQIPDIPPTTAGTASSSEIKPSIRLLFSQLNSRQRLCLLLPAVISSVIAGGIAPFMTLVVGQVFNAFSTFSLSLPTTQSSKDQLLHNIGISAIQLLGLAIGSLVLSSIVSGLWIWTGEYNVAAVRKWFYRNVTGKDMSWFDIKTTSDSQDGSEATPEGTSGAAGLMSNFMRCVTYNRFICTIPNIPLRETDDIRAASSLATGLLVQYATTCITCLVLAFIRSWSLTLVILSALPILVIVQGLSQVLAGPLFQKEQSQIARMGNIIDRATTAIATVKAFNAELQEHFTLSSIIDDLKVTDNKLAVIWGFTSGFSQFVAMAMFVQGFWFGAKLVRENRIAPGDVMAVFWACLIAASHLQLSIPQLILLNKGKFAAAGLHNTVSAGDSSPSTKDISLPRPSITLTHQKRWSSSLRKIIPTKCYGELSMHGVTFYYPSRPSVAALEDVSLYLPAGETTFIVGGSGSGKSTIAQLLLGMYAPQQGSVHLDDQDIAFLDTEWMREHVAGVSQTCHLFDSSVHDNIALAVNSGDSATVPRKDVIAACTLALIHDFVKDLPDGYDTKLGNAGTNLSGGQKQRIAIARARVRDPDVLILGMCSSSSTRR
jgi:ATP-binding cassette, subfamily B (MDR/TAP), member 1